MLELELSEESVLAQREDEACEIQWALRAPSLVQAWLHVDLHHCVGERLCFSVSFVFSSAYLVRATYIAEVACYRNLGCTPVETGY